MTQNRGWCRWLSLWLVATLLGAGSVGARDGANPADQGVGACDDCVPGELMVRFVPSVTTAQIEKLNRDYGFEWKRLYARAPYNWGILEVAEHQERFWMGFLRGFPFIKSVEPNAVRSLGASIALSGWATPAPAASGAVAGGAANFPARLRGFVRKQFGQAQHRFVPLGSNLLQVEIAGVKGEVIAQQAFWEKIVMHLVFESSQPPRLHVMLEGWFAPGIGSRPPEQNAYRSMQPQYTESLREYLALTQTRIFDYLESGQAQ